MMFGQFLTAEARVVIEEMRGNTRDKGAYMKLSVLILLDMGKDYDEIELILGIGRGTITNCRQKYDKDGLDKYLDRHYVPFSGKLSPEALQAIEKQVSDGIYCTSQEVQAYILQAFGADYSLSAVRSILQKLDFVYKKTSELPGNFDTSEQEAFLVEFEPFLEEITENEIILFADAVHPQHNTRSSYAWIKKGQDKLIPSNTGRRRININGVMNAHHPEKVIIHEADTINAEATIALYDKIQQRYADKDRIYVIGDNARYYQNAQLQAWLTPPPALSNSFYLLTPPI